MRSDVDVEGATVEGDHPICEFCGAVIEETGQRCDALDDGRCRR